MKFGGLVATKIGEVDVSKSFFSTLQDRKVNKDGACFWPAWKVNLFSMPKGEAVWPAVSM